MRILQWLIVWNRVLVLDSATMLRRSTRAALHHLMLHTSLHIPKSQHRHNHIRIHVERLIELTYLPVCFEYEYSMQQEAFSVLYALDCADDGNKEDEEDEGVAISRRIHWRIGPALLWPLLDRQCLHHTLLASSSLLFNRISLMLINKQTLA